MSRYIIAIALLLAMSSTAVTAADDVKPSAAPKRISDGCLTALNATSLASPCMNSLMDTEASNDFGQFCSVVTDGTKCSVDEMNKAIRTLDGSCMDELKAEQSAVLHVYINWASYSLYQGMCVKDANGEFCKVKNATTIISEGKCSDCEMARINNIAKWTPPQTSISLASSFNATRINAKEIKYVCDGLRAESVAAKGHHASASMLAGMTIVAGMHALASLLSL
ncbi:hypothetical protein SYNPS1DRAFT_27296 [Syncephalis pseudoplumigaleata]|uniref:Uncharacterized protein n=1 Tax=Syncephalis pseudoplumigaleata TaxID=1712513 RepID=A0A4P9Z5Y2_9FUNG|nr:hypothetical protein SYNPS1DRAFT_27296 [Syncephalis pseudoplumigaleata]|eukprot:RKP27040.1 hypothetical protein SYNPS1DRAFT_27296 [Syncephalis pseudoplumigaleata]